MYLYLVQVCVSHLVILMIKNIPRDRVWSHLSRILHGSQSLDEDLSQNMSMACVWVFFPSFSI